MKAFVFFSPVALLVIFLCIKLFSPACYVSLIQEDSIIEYAQVVFYLISAILSAHVSIKSIKNKLQFHGLLYGMLSIVLLLIVFEEISWGQRILGITNPVFFQQHNSQGELSLHNLSIVQPKLHNLYILISAYGVLAWIFTSLFLSKSKANCRHIANFVVPEWFISSYFVPTLFIYTMFEYISPPYPGGFLVWRDQEPVELLLSMGFFSFALINCIRLKSCLTRRSS